MADRSAAASFGLVFNLLSKNPTAEHKAMAKLIWNNLLDGDWDFSLYQMYEDEALIALDLARIEEDEEGTENVLYLMRDGSWE